MEILTPYSQEDFEYILHQFAFHLFLMNLNSIQLNLNPIVELNFVKLKFNQIYLGSIKFKFNSICIAMLFMLQFHIGMN